MHELTPADYLVILKRRRNYFFLAFGIVAVLSLIVALTWSNYRSVATVEIQQPEISADVTTLGGMNPTQTLEALADLRINKLQQKVTAPASLVEVITKFNLYAGARNYTPIDVLANRMRDKIKLQLMSGTVANPAAAQKVSANQLAAIAFTLSFDYKDPQAAQQVTNELISRFLDEDLKQRHEQAEATSEFLGTQIAMLEAAMAEQEKKIAEFEKEHGVARPESLMFNQQAAVNLTMSLQNLDSQIAANEGTQGSLRAQLTTVDPYTRVIADGQVLTTPATQLKALEAQYSTLTAQYGPQHPDVVKTKHQIEALRSVVNGGGKKPVDVAPLKAKIEDLRTNLAAAESTNGADHPDTVALKEQLKKLEEQLEAADKDQSAFNWLKTDADNPAYLAFVQQLKAAEEQHKALVAQREQLAAEQAKYQQAIAANPELQQKMAALTRDYDNSQLRYREMKAKKMAADMEQQMVQDRKGERLIVINPPNLPTKTQPPRLLLIVGGLFLAMIAGLGTVVAVHTVNQTVFGADHLAALVGAMPLVTVPHIFTADEILRAGSRKPYLIGAAVAAALVGLLVFHLAIMPLDVLLNGLLQKFGIG